MLSCSQAPRARSSKISEKISRLAPWQVGLVNLSSPLGIVLLKVSGRLMNRSGKSHLMLQNLGIAIDTSVVAALIFTHSHTGTPTLMRGFRQSWDYAASTILFCFVVFFFVRTNHTKITVQRKRGSSSLLSPISYLLSLTSMSPNLVPQVCSRRLFDLTYRCSSATLRTRPKQYLRRITPQFRQPTQGITVLSFILIRCLYHPVTRRHPAQYLLP